MSVKAPEEARHPKLNLSGGVKPMTKKKEMLLEAAEIYSMVAGQELFAAIPKEIKDTVVSDHQKQTRHQGDREKQRRLRQIMAGHIQK